jgi:hypothetical protein
VRIKVNTHFDITRTGINRVYKSQHLPCKINGKLVNSEEEWNTQRKQQNNFETVVQVLGMRGTPTEISEPVQHNGVWSFSFEVDNTLVYGENLELLIKEIEGTPMVIGLTEQENLDPFLNSDNIWFETDV